MDEDLIHTPKKKLFQRTKDKALSLLTYRSYTSADLRRRLTEWCGDGDIAQDVVTRMAELGLIDDEDYAGRYAKELSERRGFGTYRIRQEMRRKGLDEKFIDQALEELQTDPVSSAREVLEKKYPQWDTDEKIRRRGYQALVRRGFPGDVIRRAMWDE